MKVGAVYPQIELGGDPVALDRIARAAEDLGYDHFLMYDHVVGAARNVERDPPLWEGGPYSDKDPFHDPLVAFGYIAAITKRIDLMTGVLILPQRQTVLVAKQATDVDLLSGGRLHLGVGIGWNYVEYDALGEDFHRRGERLNEQIPFLRRLWSEPLVTFEGTFDRIDRGNIIPRPRRRIPIYCGGMSEPAYRRAAALADGFIFGGPYDALALPAWKSLQQHLAAAGRSTDGFRAQWLTQNETVGGLGVQESADAIRRWEDDGGTHASIVTMGRGFTTTEQHIDHLTQVWQRLGG